MSVPDPLLCFVHIPRTAGTSLWRWFTAHMPRVRARRQWHEQVIPLIWGHRMKEVEAPAGWGLAGQALKEYITPLREDDAVRVIGGHLVYGIHRVLPRPVQYLTVLRDPIERVLSLYSMFAARPVTYDQQGQPIGDPITHYWQDEYALSLLRMLDAREYRLCNDQVRMITGGSEDVDEAIALLEQAYLWTTLPRLAALHQPLCAWLSLGQDTAPFPHTNQLERVTGARKAPVQRYRPSQAELEAMREANQADLALYAWAETSQTTWAAPAATATW